MIRIEVVAGILEESGRFLLGQRTRTQSFPLQWEFPGGKVEPGETPEAALRREFLEEIGVEVTVGDLFAEIAYAKSEDTEIRVRFFRVSHRRGEPQPREVAAVAWVPAAELEQVDFIRFNRDIVEKLRRGDA